MLFRSKISPLLRIDYQPPSSLFLFDFLELEPRSPPYFRRDCSPTRSPEVKVSFPPFPLFLPLPPMPLRAAAGDRCRRFSIGERDLCFGLFPMNFSAPAIEIDRRPRSSVTGGVAPLCRRPLPRRPWPERPDTRRGLPSPVRPGRNQEKEEKKREKEKEEKEKRKKKKREKEKERKKEEKEEKEKKKRKEKKRKEKKKIYIYLYIYI